MLPSIQIRNRVKSVFRKHFYGITWMRQYGAFCGDCIEPSKKCEYKIEFWGPDKYHTVLGTSKYLSDKDIEEFDRCMSVCIIAKDNGHIIGSSWMVRGNYYMNELKSWIKIGEKEFFSTRTFVNPKYQGLNLLSHMIYSFSKNYASKDEKVWGLIFDWNIASIKGVSKIGWNYERDVGFVKILGGNFVLYKYH